MYQQSDYEANKNYTYASCEARVWTNKEHKVYATYMLSASSRRRPKLSDVWFLCDDCYDALTPNDYAIVERMRDNA